MRAVMYLVPLFITSAALATNRGQYAQVDPGIRQWFGSQAVPSGPSKGMSCCAYADGTTAEEAWHGDHYKAAFTVINPITNEEVDVPWMDVPPEAVLQGPFPAGVGQAIVWWWAEWSDSRKGEIKKDENGKPLIHIRCFKPGSGT